MKLSITLDEAKYLHQDYYEKKFIITNITRRGQCDVPPWSFVYGLSDIGSWEGNISTDGSNFVVTKSGYTNADKVKEIYKFNKDDIKNISVGLFKSTIEFKENNPGLTKRSSLATYILLLSGTIFFPIFLLFPKKIFQFKIENEYDTKSEFENFLKNSENFFKNTELIEDNLKSNEKYIKTDSNAKKEITDVEFGNSNSIEIRLEKLNELKEKNIITQEDYNRKKVDILKDI